MKKVIIVLGLLIALVSARPAISDDTIIIHNNSYPYAYSPYGGEYYIYVIPNEGNLFVEPTPFGPQYLMPPELLPRNFYKNYYQTYRCNNYGVCN